MAIKTKSKKMKIIVLNVQQYKDNDIIVDAINENGPISFKVRGASKPTSPFIWLNNRLVIAEVEYVENVRYRHQILKNAKLISYPIKDNKYSNLLAINLANEAMNAMLEKEEQYKMFSELEGYIKAVKEYDDPLLAELIFLSKMCEVAGFGLEVNKCVYCGKTNDIVAFSFSEGGFICRSCLHDDILLDLNKDQMKLIRSVINHHSYKDLPNEKISVIDKKLLLTKFNEFIHNAVGANLGSISLILKN